MTYIPLRLKCSLFSYDNRKPCIIATVLFLCCLSRSKYQLERSVLLMNCKKEILEVHEQKSRKENLLYCIVSRVLHCTTRGG